MDSLGNLYKFSYITFAFLQSLVACNPMNADARLDQSYLQLTTVTCHTCHSANGREAGTIPNLDNLTADQVKQLLTAYKTDQEKVTIMNRIAKALTDDEIDQLSALFNKTGN